jgi:hypothetical protein
MAQKIFRAVGHRPTCPLAGGSPHTIGWVRRRAFAWTVLLIVMSKRQPIWDILVLLIAHDVDGVWGGLR